MKQRTCAYSTWTCRETKPDQTLNYPPSLYSICRTVFILSEALDEQLKALWFSPFQTDDIETELDMVSTPVFSRTVIPNYYGARRVAQDHHCVLREKIQFYFFLISLSEYVFTTNNFVLFI